MFVTSSLGTNEKGHLTIGGADAVELAQKFGTPLYVLDERTIRGHCRAFSRSLTEDYAGDGLVLYASKALACKELYRIMKDEGLGVDVVSGGELYTALSVGFPAEKIYFHGNNKTEEELRYAISSGVGTIVIDNLEELDTVASLSAHSSGKTVEIMLRIKPGIDAHTHDFIRTGQIDSKFGFALETGEAFEAVKKALSLDGVSLTGVHCHIGSQIFEYEPFEAAADTMLRFMRLVADKTGHTLKKLDLGGGFGIRYLIGDDAKLYRSFMCRLSKRIKATCDETGFPLPYLLIEPGRSIVGPAGTTLYTVGAVKNIPNVRTYVLVDGGMCDNPRYALYRSQYTAAIANRALEDPAGLFTIAGRCCESGDLIQENAPLQSCKKGDILAVFCTGAYNYSMASNYNRFPRPEMIMITNGEPRVIIKRETYEDIIRNDL